jgi:hypothetical protein
MTRIVLPHCVIEWEPQYHRAVTRWNDGTEAYACPHDTDDYRAHATEKSTGDIELYCWQHDIAHVIAGYIAGRNASIVLWNLAHGLPVDTPECEAEEQAAQQFQRAFFLRP